MRTTSTSSFAQNLLSMQSELRRFALKLTADPEDANDLLQETSLKALDNEDKYTPDTNFKGWMYTIMRNIFINNYRKTVRDQTFIDQTDNLFHLNICLGFICRGHLFVLFQQFRHYSLVLEDVIITHTKRQTIFLQV